MTRPVEIWRRFWFEPQSPTNLGLGRAVFCGFLWMWYLRTDFTLWSPASAVFHTPTYFFEALSIPVLSEPALAVMQAVWKASLLSAAVGLFTRSSLAVAALLGFYLLGIPNSVGMTQHTDCVLLIVLGILACSRCGDAWSLDRLRRPAAAPPSGEYRWPVRLIWAAITGMFFAAGCAKLIHSGFAWASADNMRGLLLGHHYYFGGLAPTRLGLYPAQSPALCGLLAAMTLTLELSAPLVLVHRRARALLAPALFLMLAGFPLVLGVLFTPVLATFVFFVPWDHSLSSRPTARRPRAVPGVPLTSPQMSSAVRTTTTR